MRIDTVEGNPDVPNSRHRTQARRQPYAERSLVAEAKNYTSNLSATMEELLADYVVEQQQSREGRRQLADACAADWNAVYEEVGSFADEHSTL